MSTNNWQSQYIYLETTGYVDDLRIDFGDSETLYPLVLKSLTINAPEPFFFNNLRFMLVLGVLLLIYCFPPEVCHLSHLHRQTRAQGEGGHHRYDARGDRARFELHPHGIEFGGCGNFKLQLRIVGR